MEHKQNALLVGVNELNQSYFEESMEELSNLAIACEYNVVGKIVQNLKAINKVFYMGSGKVKEVVTLIDELDVDAIIFNNELTPSQLRNLEKTLKRNILDRTSVILEIFSKRAKTREAKLQVEVARLQYMLPRLIGLNEAMGRQSGGVGTKNKGTGEKQLELDRRKIEGKIIELNKELKLINNERQTQRKKRNKAELPVVALVGYTNAGKSTLMNAIIDFVHKSEDKKVLEKDMLFATLETSVRNIKLKDNKTFLLADTVGFVSKLPHNLVKAFRSTLEEVRDADLLLHIIDTSNPNYKQQIEVTNETLKQIGVKDTAIVYVYNKSDLTEKSIPIVENDDVYISAKYNIGLEELVEVIKSKIFRQYFECQMLIPYDQGSIVSYLNEFTHVKSVSYRDNGTLLTIECRQRVFDQYKQFVQ